MSKHPIDCRLAASALIGLGIALGPCAALADAPTMPKPVKLSDKPITIAFLLPENSNVRWDEMDRPAFIKMAKLTDPNVKLIVTNANGSPDTQLNQAQSAISNGATVLVVCPTDGKAAASIVSFAARNDVPVISYDRLIQDSKPAYYVSFNNHQVGVLQGKYIAAHTKPGGTIIMINGAATDPNAFDFKGGAMSVLQPLVDAGKLKIGYDVMTPQWSTENAFQEAQQALTKLDDKVDGVLAANDTTAAGSIRALQAVGLAGKIPVTGQDATNGGLTLILEGLQSMSVFKYVPEEAAASAQLAVAIATGTKPPVHLINAKVNNGKADIPAVLLKPLVVTADTLASSVIKSGYTKWSDICIDAAANSAACKSASN
jgi:D-xylose transport system substrate-binding protein